MVLTQEEMKRLVAKYALSFIHDDMVIGVGSGSTALEFFKLLAEKIRQGELKRVKLVPTSTEIEYYASVFKVEDHLAQLWQVDHVDIAVDGADEVDRERNLVKGGGGALTSEKIVDYNAKQFIVIVDETKLVEKLGQKHAIPIEVLPRAWRVVAGRVESMLGGQVALRVLDKGKRGPLITDNGNYLLDWKKVIEEDPEEVEHKVKTIPGVVEVGIFSKRYVHKVLVAFSDGRVAEI